MKKAVMILSERFPAKHKRAGVPTMFFEQIHLESKIHTIRNNSDWWKQKCESVNSGKMYLSLRKWTGEPYNSVQEEKYKYYSVGWQPVIMIYATNNEYPRVWVDGREVSIHDIARNDGLSTSDFVDWFFGNSKSNVYSGAIIHFTDFRY